MCGRVNISSPPDRLARLFEADLAPDAAAGWEPRGKVALGHTIFGVERRRSDDGEPGGPLVLDRYHWALVPRQQRQWPTGKPKYFNAKVETLSETWPFRGPLAASQTLAVPVDGFYEAEWRGDGTKTGRSFYFSRRDGKLIVLAGLYELWQDPALGDGPDVWRRSCTVLTCTPNSDVADIHPRMPVILDERQWRKWLAADAVAANELGILLRPAPDGLLLRRLVEKRPGKARTAVRPVPAAEKPHASDLADAAQPSLFPLP